MIFLVKLTFFVKNFRLRLSKKTFFRLLRYGGDYVVDVGTEFNYTYTVYNVPVIFPIECIHYHHRAIGVVIEALSDVDIWSCETMCKSRGFSAWNHHTDLECELLSRVIRREKSAEWTSGISSCHKATNKFTFGGMDFNTNAEVHIDGELCPISDISMST